MSSEKTYHELNSTPFIVAMETKETGTGGFQSHWTKPRIHEHDVGVQSLISSWYSKNGTGSFHAQKENDKELLSTLTLYSEFSLAMTVPVVIHVDTDSTSIMDSQNVASLRSTPFMHTHILFGTEKETLTIHQPSPFSKRIPNISIISSSKIQQYSKLSQKYTVETISQHDFSTVMSETHTATETSVPSNISSNQIANTNTMTRPISDQESFDQIVPTQPLESLKTSLRYEKPLVIDLSVTRRSNEDGMSSKSSNICKYW